MNDNDEAVINLLLYVAGIFVAILVTRWIFSIGTMVRNLKAQTQLLLLMAKKQGVNIELLNKISLKAEVFTPHLNEPENTTVTA